MNDNKSTVMNNAAVQQLRKVPGFDPMKLLRKTISVKTGHPVWKLDLRYQRFGPKFRLEDIMRRLISTFLAIFMVVEASASGGKVIDASV